MNAIKVKKSELLKTLHANRENHRNIFLEAQAGYRAFVIKELDVMLTDAKEGRRIRRSINVIEPQDQTKDYDRAIKMLDMSEDETVMLSEEDFANYVQDDWNWKRGFLAANSAYSVTATRALNQLGDEY